MPRHEQYQLSIPTDPQSQPVQQSQDFVSAPNVLQTAKQILSNDTVSGKHFRGNYIVRGINSTGYSTVTVFDAGLEGLHQIRTTVIEEETPDTGDATITMNGPGEKGQEMYLKIDNDTDANRTITFGSYLKVTGTLTGSTAATAILHFISDSNYFWEVSRTTGLNQI